MAQLICFHVTAGVHLVSLYALLSCIKYYTHITRSTNRNLKLNSSVDIVIVDYVGILRFVYDYKPTTFNQNVILKKTI